MKIATFGLDIQPGKCKYKDEYFDKLVQRFSPQKASPFVAEFIGEDLEKGEAIVFNGDKKIDFVLIDLEKVEKRLQRSEDEKERELLTKIQSQLEQETLLSDVTFSPQEQDLLKNLAFVTYKPSLAVPRVDDINQLIKGILDKAGILLFFTVAKKEVRAWGIPQGTSVLEAAGKIHSDLARGFIKAEVVNCKNLDAFFNMAEARAKGLVTVVDKEYCVHDGDIIEIKFNV